MTSRFQRVYPPSVPATGPALWLLFQNDEVVLPNDGPLALLEGTTEAPAVGAVETPLLLGMLNDMPVMFGELVGEQLPEGFQRYGLRALLAQADAGFCDLAGYGAQLLRWGRISRFCPSCSNALVPLDGWGKKCPACGFSIYPPVSPAVIVLIHDDADGVLLSTKPGWGKRYSLVAGFVEPNESLEQCVAREIREEVGVEVDTIRYVDSQPWPFPHQLMIGFTARYAGGDIVIDAHELADARWFKLDDLPELPQPYTIARQIIERWRAHIQSRV